jgi:hypothetical protein
MCWMCVTSHRKDNLSKKIQDLLFRRLVFVTVYGRGGGGGWGAGDMFIH